MPMRVLFRSIALATFVAATLAAHTGALGKPQDDRTPAPFVPPAIEDDAELSHGPLKPLRDKTTPAQRKKVLKDLYEQLEASSDAGSATILARAIEKVWLDSGSDTIDLLMVRAIRAIHAKDLDLALELLDFVTQLAPDFPEGWNKRAIVHYMKEDYAESIEDLKEVLARDPHHFKAIHGLSLLFRELGQSKAALKAIRKAMQFHPFLEHADEVERELSQEVEGQGI